MNNPVNRTDSDGTFGVWAVVGITLAASVIGAVGQILSNCIGGAKGKDLYKHVIGNSYFASCSVVY